MAKHINGYHEKKIVDVINTWSIDEKLTLGCFVRQVSKDYWEKTIKTILK